VLGMGRTGLPLASTRKSRSVTLTNPMARSWPPYRAVSFSYFRHRLVSVMG
jgi:hypothetical protein